MPESQESNLPKDELLDKVFRGIRLEFEFNGAKAASFLKDMILDQVAEGLNDNSRAWVYVVEYKTPEELEADPSTIYIGFHQYSTEIVNRYGRERVVVFSMLNDDIMPDIIKFLIPLVQLYTM